MESDFSKNLVELTLAEGEDGSGYQKLAQQNNLSEVSPEPEMECKNEASSNLKKYCGELTGDDASVTSKLVGYLTRLNDPSVANMGPCAESATDILEHGSRFGFNSALKTVDEAHVVTSYVLWYS